LALAVAVNRENREYDAEGQLRLRLKPTRDGTWPLSELAHGGCGEDGGPVRRLGRVLRGECRVLGPVGEVVEAVGGQNIMRTGGHAK
jgi:hypothetical protein